MPTQYWTQGRATGPGDIFVATTSVSAPKPNYIASWDMTRVKLAEAGIVADYLLHVGDCHVDDARNVCMRKFLESGCPKAIFIDDDVGWDADEFITFIKHDKDVVAGIYPKKADEPDFPVMTYPGILKAEDNGLVKVRGVPTGFLMMSRAAIERMAENSIPYFQEQQDEAKTALMFERGVVNGKRWSGDYYWCRKWAEIGGEIFVDPELHLSHAGIKTWNGCLADYWREQHGVADPYIKGALDALRDGKSVTAVADVLVSRWGNYPWSCEPELLVDVFHHAKETDGHIFETGSGLSTLVMGIACLGTNKQVWSLEHDVKWLKKIQPWIVRMKLEPVRLCYAPLRGQPDGSFWYEQVKELPDSFSLAVCDGPPRDVANRDALWRVYGDKVSDAKWIVDDITDPQKFESWGRNVDLRGRHAVITPK